MTRGFILIACMALPGAVAGAQTPPANIYAAGVSWNAGATPSVAGTAIYARLLSQAGTYAFTAADILPASNKPFTVTTNFGGGIGQKLLTVGPASIYLPTAAGISFNGTNTGWQWDGGFLISIPLKGSYRLMPMARFLRSNVSNGSGYQPIIGVLLSWGQ